MQGAAAEVWDEYFRAHQPDPRAICNTVLQLHKAGKTEHAIACLEAALLHGQSQPWMYTILALEMEKASRPREEVERVLLSNVDFSAVNVANLMYSAAFLARFGAKEQALALYRQASRVDATRLEPYLLGLKLAREAADVDAVAWAATGILTRCWTKDFETHHREAEAALGDLSVELRRQGRIDEAQRLVDALAQALVRDLSIELSWSGKADIDLYVEEPAGAVCSSTSPTTAGGGIFVHDGFGGLPHDTFDKYVCPRGQSGEYRAVVRHVSGDVVGKRAVLRVIRYQGTPREVEDRFTVELAEHDKVVRISLNHGRLQELSALPLLRAGEAERVFAGRGGPGAGGGGRRERVAFRQAPLRQGAVGFQPVIDLISEGVTTSALAVVSGDRRYVRMSILPIFSAITDVQTFSFINSGGNPTGGRGGAATGGGGGARGFVTGVTGVNQ
ncbi:MAG: tetratricopeptide repeat protein [Planctomycetaceae bacterium]